MPDLDEQFLKDHINHYFKDADNNIKELVTIKEDIAFFYDHDTGDGSIQYVCTVILHYTYIGPTPIPEFPKEVKLQGFLPIWEKEGEVEFNIYKRATEKEAISHAEKEATDKGTIYGYLDLSTGKSYWVGKK